MKWKAVHLKETYTLRRFNFKLLHAWSDISLQINLRLSIILLFPVKDKELILASSHGLKLKMSWIRSFSLHKTFIDGLETCGSLEDYCDVLNRLFEISFWRHPFATEDPLVSKWSKTKKHFYFSAGLRWTILSSSFWILLQQTLGE